MQKNNPSLHWDGLNLYPDSLEDYILIDKNEIQLYTVSDIQRIFQIGRTNAYRLMTSDGFPSIRLNKKLYISHEKLEKWLNQQAGKEYSF